MKSDYKFSNELKTGTGIRRFFQPANADVLSAPADCKISDEQIPDEAKRGNLNISYSPQSYLLTQNDAKELVLVDICGKEAELPQTLATFCDGEIQKIQINRYALFIDIKTRDNINSAPTIQKKKQLAEVGKIFKHFNQINEMPIELTIAHELKHLQNKRRLDDICEKIEKSGLSAKEFALTRYADEISATAQEFLNCVQKYNVSQDKKVFPQKFLAFSKVLTNPKVQNILHSPVELTAIAAQMWLGAQNNQAYTGKRGNFVHQTIQYSEQASATNRRGGKENFTKIIKAYMTLDFEGKKVDCSEIMREINPLSHIYEDAEENLEQKSAKNLGASHCARQMRNIKSK